MFVDETPTPQPRTNCRKRAPRVLLSALLLCSAWTQGDAASAQTTLPATKIYFEPPDRPGGIGPKGELPLPKAFESSRKTWREIRDAGVVRQGWDYSCGAAALATLLATPEEPVTEKEILLETLSGMTDEEQHQLMEAGLSLLDLQKVAQGRGLRAAGYRVDPETLPEIARPVLVFIKPQGYRHFAVLRGIREDRAFLADPARGNVRLPIWQFLEMWQDEDGKGVLFIVGADTPPTLELAKEVPTRPELMSVRQLMNAASSTPKRFPRP